MEVTETQTKTAWVCIVVCNAYIYHPLPNNFLMCVFYLVSVNILDMLCSIVPGADKKEITIPTVHFGWGVILALLVHRCKEHVARHLRK